MTDSLILNEFRTSYRVLNRNVIRTLRTLAGRTAEIARQADEVTQFWRAAVLHRGVFTPDEYTLLENNIRAMLGDLTKTLDSPAAEVGDPAVTVTAEPRAMHPTLHIAEIVRIIVSYLDPGTNASDLASLARTCTIFHGPALDFLWRHQTTIMNLVKCMPADLWATHGTGARTMRLSRPVEAADWDRPFHYSHRIRSLTIQHYLQNERMSNVYGVLALGIPRDYLLPNLQALSWEPGVETFSFIHLFLAPRITSISLPDFDSVLQFSLLTPLARRFPALTVVKLGERWDSESPSKQSCTSAFVSQLGSVTSLEVNTLNLAAITHLGRSPTLETLRLGLSATTPLSGLLDRGLFRNLVSVELWCHENEGTKSVTDFVRTWSSPPLRSLGVEWCYPPTAEATEEFCLALKEHCSHDSLHTLDMKVNSAVDPLNAIPGGVFRPLFCFSNLASVSIAAPVGYRLDDAMISELSAAWPRVEELRFKHGQHSTTLLALHALAKHCPKLHTLEMSLDASSVPMPPADLYCRKQLLHEALVSLDVGQSPILHAFDVARWISATFFSLYRIATDREDAGDSEADFADPNILAEVRYHMLWKDVEDLLPSLNDMRAEEFQWGLQSVDQTEYFPFDPQVPARSH
ncbi:hypothetical protein C8R47DRAFT_1147413 [Mycena vitilis]|nr:hypothetical protein C8R47DRAFT_1147413 [Mycena vitilis]